MTRITPSPNLELLIEESRKALAKRPITIEQLIAACESIDFSIAMREEDRQKMVYDDERFNRLVDIAKDLTVSHLLTSLASIIQAELMAELELIEGSPSRH